MRASGMTMRLLLGKKHVALPSLKAGILESA